jgi:hypothetical protein
MQSFSFVLHIGCFVIQSLTGEVFNDFGGSFCILTGRLFLQHES